VNYKLLLPTYRARQRWVLRILDRLGRDAEIGQMINVGCGEGDIDREFYEFSAHLIACDLNEGDVAHARALNTTWRGIEYLVANAHELPFDDARFDVACCIEVIEHVADPRACLRELARIVRAGGHVVLTCPSARFPLTYDPLNWALSRTGKHVSMGAFGYGHSWLVREEELTDWASDAGLGLVDSVRLSKALVGLVEAYWAGLVQSVVKANAKNRGGEARRPVEETRARARVLPTVRPSLDKPPLLAMVDAFIDADDRLFGPSQASVGLGFLFEKRHRD
jgi:2-polyprenyl-3-methyl-5-hydroxy-6-metoxy-1,4-benzoquinol methylase